MSENESTYIKPVGKFGSVSVTSDESRKRKRRRRRPLVIVGVVCAFSVLAASNLYGQVEAWKATIIEDAAYITICDDRVFLSLASLTTGSCVAESRNYAKQCWKQLNSVIGTGTEFAGEASHEEKRERDIDISWLFARCIQSSILLPHTTTLFEDNHLKKIDELAYSQVEPSNWKAIIEKSVLIYEDIKPSLVLVQEKLSNSVYDSVYKVSQDKVRAALNENDERISVQPSTADSWLDLFNSSQLDSVGRYGSGYYFKYGSLIENSKYAFDLTFVDSAADGLKECQSDYTGVDCGACDVKLDVGVVARIVWLSNDIMLIDEQQDISSSDTMILEGSENSSAMKCWIDGMGKLGYDPSELDALSSPRK